MRNQSPEDSSSIVPFHLQAEWEDVSRQLREASEELIRVDSLYRQTMMARLSLGDSISDSTAWETLREERNQAQKRHLAAMTLRLDFTRKVNGEL